MDLPADHPRLFKRRPYSDGELIADGVVHAAALVAGVIAFSLLFGKVALHGGAADGLAMAVYAAGFFLMFGFSLRLQHDADSPVKWILRRCDHSAIYLMIAGTYTALLSLIPDSLWAIGARRLRLVRRARRRRAEAVRCPAASTASRPASISRSAGRRSSRSGRSSPRCRPRRWRSSSSADSSIPSASRSISGTA